MIKITPQEDIDIISKRTDFGYKVLQIGINERTHKIINTLEELRDMME